MKKRLSFVLIFFSLVILVIWLSSHVTQNIQQATTQIDLDGPASLDLSQITKISNPLQIEQMRKQTFPGSAIAIVEQLPKGSNYTRQVVSYESEGNTIYALMTIPQAQRPETGWPVIVFNHGYIPPTQYRTTERYVAYVDYFARSGYVVFKSDYRGHGDSEGEASGGYGSPGYTVDVLNAVASLKQHPVVDENRLGMWGHSMGGYITLRNMVISSDIKAGVIWGGVVASYQDLLTNWRRRSTMVSPTPMPSGARRWRDMLQEMYGAPDANPTFWDSISANAFLTDISGPIQLHHARGDATVPWEFSQSVADQMKVANKEAELYLYEGDDHDITNNFGTAMRRSLEFFDKYVKGGS